MGSEVTTTPQVSAQSFSELEVPFDEFVQPLGLIGRSQWVPMSRQHFSQSKKSGWSFWPSMLAHQMGFINRHLPEKKTGKSGSDNALAANKHKEVMFVFLIWIFSARPTDSMMETL